MATKSFQNSQYANDFVRAEDFSSVGAALAHGISVGKMVEFSSNTTVRIPTDVPTLQEAVDYIKADTSVTITLLIVSGHVLTSGILIDAGRYCRNFLLSAEDSVVYCTLPSDGILLGAIHGAYLPEIRAVFDMQGTGNIGIYARRSGKADVRRGCGVINAGVTGAYAYRGGVINASVKHTSPDLEPPCVFTGAGVYGARARRGGIFNGVASDLSGAGTAALQLDHGGQAQISAATVSNAGAAHIICQNGSIAQVGLVTLSDGPLRTNIPPNVVTRSGIIIAADGLSHGSWTPVLVGSTTAGTNTYSSNTGRWVIQHGVVQIWGRIVLTNLASVGTLTIEGWPFAVSADLPSSAFYPCTVTLNAGGALPSGNRLAMRYSPSGVFTLRNESNTASTAMNNTHATNTLDISFHVSYEVDIPVSTSSWR